MRSPLATATRSVAAADKICACRAMGSSLGRYFFCAYAMAMHPRNKRHRAAARLIGGTTTRTKGLYPERARAVDNIKISIGRCMRRMHFVRCPAARVAGARPQPEGWVQSSAYFRCTDIRILRRRELAARDNPAGVRVRNRRERSAVSYALRQHESLMWDYAWSGV